MKYPILILLFFNLFFAQSQTLEATFDSQFLLKADVFIGVDTFENYYYIIGNTFYKKTPHKTYSYNNTSLSAITTVDISNPLKIVVFYQEFNTVVILDNRLNELTDTINFSIESFAKNVASVSLSSTNNLWLYSLDDNILTLWNYETKKTVLNTQPLSFYSEDFESTFQTSTYEHCWLASTNTVLKFNEYGSFVSSYEDKNIKKLVSNRNGYFYIANNNMFYIDKNNSRKEVFINTKKHKLGDFTAVKNNLYFFDANVLYKYTVLKK
jgi:hypothetical protein